MNVRMYDYIQMVINSLTRTFALIALREPTLLLQFGKIPN